ncbi:MAG: helix-turn-helix domain-containing protein [Meiothermus sp.]|uniref:helix-turn-helix domain-containing protein n=1 Tax=Meiothermus sp. TaxID=1955249 RepID=UPI00298F3865|nr:helix-turn-helix domain-containing protein [Meiothermus sp.]MDW8482677.1 helix-turn-helix domain-containing protein [Meiothermus sp.]
MKPTDQTDQPPQPAPGKLAYRVDEVAEMLSVSATTIYELVRAGTLPHKRLGRRIVIPARALEDWINTPEPWASYDLPIRRVR